jgi:hypothetical protein
LQQSYILKLQWCLSVCLSGHYPDLCFFFFMGFVFCDNYYLIDRGGRAGKDQAGGASTGQGGARAKKDRAGGGGHGRSGGHGRGRTGRGEARRMHYAPGSH